MSKLKDFTLVSRNELLTPSDYDVCIVNNYWCVTGAGDGIVYTKDGAYSLQCNMSRLLSDRFIKGLQQHFHDAHVELINVAYLPYGRMTSQ